MTTCNCRGGPTCCRNVRSVPSPIADMYYAPEPPAVDAYYAPPSLEEYTRALERGILEPGLVLVKRCPWDAWRPARELA